MIRILLSILLITSSAFAVDTVRIAPGQDQLDHRKAYADTLLIEILKTTTNDFGPYHLTYTPHVMNRDRSLVELIKGNVINVHETATRAEWEEKTLTVRVPTRKGLMGYRIFLIHKDDSAKFSSIRTIDEIKKLKAGLRAHWSITRVMDTLGFTIISSPNYSGLFNMLDYKRFDYFSRGINEIFDEFESHKDSLPNIQIESSLAVYITTPNYFFISPKHPRLYNRIKTGMERMVQSGTFDSLFLQYHTESIKRASLQKRRIFFVDNPLLTKETPLDSLHFWYKPKGIKRD